MKKIAALILVFALLIGAVSAQAAKKNEKYERLMVGVTTPFKGNFLSDALSNNVSDLDVRKLIQGYSVVKWNPEDGSFRFNDNIVTGVTSSEDGLTFTFSIAEDLTYSDGTPITSKDYAFSLLLLASAELEEAAGGRANISRIQGGKDYQERKSKILSGFRLLSDYEFRVIIDPDYNPYYYQLKVLDVSPLPIHIIAPGCMVRDDGKGVYISGDFSAEVLKQTLLDSETGYISHPTVTCGAYRLTEYDGESVTLVLNENYAGDEEGNKAKIPQIVIKTVKPENLINEFAAGNLDLIVRVTRTDQIRSGMSLVGSGEFFMKAYMRAGLAFIGFNAEPGQSPTADLDVRKALAMCMDKEALTNSYLGSNGMIVNGYYGIGQWMFRMANGAILQEEDDESDWSDLQIDRITGYSLNVEEACALLDHAGWNLNEKGKAYQSGIRYKSEGGTLVPLKLKLVYPEGNGAAALLNDTFISNLTQAGVLLETEKLPMQDLLEQYYGQQKRTYDLVLLGTSFADDFDPSGEYDENGKSMRNGITDPGLVELAITMRKTEPGDVAEYCRRWLAYLEERSAVVSEIPLYSNAYMDFHISALHDYAPTHTGFWSMAVQDAYLSDYMEEEAEETEEGLGEGLLDSGS